MQSKNENYQKQNKIQTASGRSSQQHQCEATPLSQAAGAAKNLARFINPAELETIYCACRGEEGEFWKAKLIELAQIVETMPTTYETDGQGDQAVAHLHYFHASGADWYITERDCEEEQLQTFGLACIYEDEPGYINIAELIECGAELDLYWTPKTLGQVKAERLMSDVNYAGHPMHY